MTRVLITRKLPDTVQDAARETMEVTVRDDTLPMSPDEVTNALQNYDAVLPTLGDAFSAAAFDLVPEPRCKLLANFGVGYNHIDAEAARAAGVAVTNTPGAVTDATADIAMTLMLMVTRRASEGERMVRAGKWEGWHPTQMLGLHMTGKTVGIVGMGRIGQAIAKRCHYGFDMKVVFFNRSPKKVGEHATQLADLRAVMEASDVVVVAVPGGAETRHMIDSAALSAMKPTAFLVNIARGDVVDEAALIASLQTGVIAGAGLDVYENEPDVPDALKALENTVLLPHLGTAALEVREAMGLMAVDNLRAFFAGESLPNAV
ncbi:D-glycerate dehydrogenase [Cognatishimia sp. MH4019]|uniref:2-hydroxyacid dehydrogenase n=1 Tax=Cognatishimia sp. MH4019 TaxID=2854030 RepID=UPI001CD6881A|nr:D-glycerate dehydrogenase [Cognatishimia sp. MH4019]